MTELAEHYNPIGKAATLEVWRRRMRMPGPHGGGSYQRSANPIHL